MLLMVATTAHTYAQGFLQFDKSVTEINDGEVYLISEDMDGVEALTIKPGGKLIISPETTVSGSGIFTIEGELELLHGAGLALSGGVTTGSRSTLPSIITLHDFTYFSITGSWGQQYENATLKMGNGSIVEVCATYSQHKSGSPYVSYIGGSRDAYFITKSTVSGTGFNELADDSRINWLAIGAVANLSPGEASYCPYATEYNCENWLEGLDPAYYVCHQAPIIRDEPSFDRIPNAPLPIQLVSFDAYKKENSVTLKWVTASESNNEGFNVETSRDGRNWKNIGFVNSHAIGGNSIAELNYDFKVENAPAGNNYYRLVQQDYDGSSTKSEIRLITILTKSVEVKLFPNPTQDYITVSGISNNESIRIYDATGRLVKNEVISGDTERVTISLDNLASGVYYLPVMGVDGNFSQHSFIKK